MTEESHTSKRVSQIARYAMINGISKSCEKFSVTPDEVSHWISTLSFEELPLIERAREMIIESIVKKGPKAAGLYWGISEELGALLLNDH